MYTENLRSFFLLLCKNGDGFSESFVLYYTNKSSKSIYFQYLFFSLPDPWVHKTLTYFAVKTSMCVFVYQVFSYTANKEIRTDDLCLDVSKLNGPVTMLKCHHLKGNQLWEYDPVVSYIPVENRNKSVCHRVYYINYFIPRRVNSYRACIL